VSSSPGITPIPESLSKLVCDLVVIYTTFTVLPALIEDNGLIIGSRFFLALKQHWQLTTQITIISNSKTKGGKRQKIILLGDEVNSELYVQIHFLQYHYPVPAGSLHIAISCWGIFDEL